MNKKRSILIIISYAVLMLSAYSVMFLPNYSSASDPGKEIVLANADLGLEHILNKYAKLFNSDKYKVSVEDFGQELADAAVVYQSHLDQFDSADYVKTEVATDNVVVTVSRRNALSNLTVSQLSEIISGRVNTWKTLNGSDEKIIVVADEGGYRYLAEKFVDVSAVNLIRNADINYFVEDDEFMMQIVHASLLSSDCKAVSLGDIAPNDYENYPLRDPVIFAYRSKYNDVFKNIDLLRY